MTRLRWPWCIALAATLGLASCADDGGDLDVQLQRAERDYQAGRQAEAIQSLNRIVEKSQSNAQRARALYVRGLARATSGDRRGAYLDLEKAASLAGKSDVGWKAQGVLGVMQFEDQRWTAAAGSLSTAIDSMPTGPPMDAYLFRLGLCLERTGRWREALTRYDRIVRQFPGSRYAELASRRLQLQAAHFAVQCGVFDRASSAQAQVAQLRREGFDAYTRQEQRSGRTAHVVLVGRFGSYEQALETLRRVKGYVPDAVLWP